MKGLFNISETKSTSIQDGKVLSCVSCGMYKNTQNKFKPYGKGQQDIMIIGDAPTDKEDQTQKPFLSAEARILRKILEKNEIDLYKDCYSLYACACVCGDKIPADAVKSCRKNVYKYIQELKPRVIITLGVNALVSVVEPKWKGNIEGLEKWRGWQIPDNEWHCYICPTYHYSDIEDDEVMQLLFEKDIDNAVFLPTLKKRKEPNIKIIDDLSVLNTIESGMVSIDLETTGIKPHRKGHRIVCASVAYDEDNCYSFLLPDGRKEKQPFIDLLINLNIKKMAHNMKFEHTWIKERLRVEVVNWYFDSMIAAHILDNRQGICGLKFLSYVMLGIGDYSSDIEHYLTSPGKDCNEFNKVIELSKNNKEKLLTYCGLDTIYQYRIAVEQIKQIGL